jgi:hypothetical protein
VCVLADTLDLLKCGLAFEVGSRHGELSEAIVLQCFSTLISTALWWVSWVKLDDSDFGVLSLYKDARVVKSRIGSYVLSHICIHGVC